MRRRGRRRCGDNRADASRRPSQVKPSKDQAAQPLTTRREALALYRAVRVCAEVPRAAQTACAARRSRLRAALRRCCAPRRCSCGATTRVCRGATRCAKARAKSSRLQGAPRACAALACGCQLTRRRRRYLKDGEQITRLIISGRDALEQVLDKARSVGGCALRFLSCRSLTPIGRSF